MTFPRAATLTFLKKAMRRLYVVACVAAYLIGVFYVERMHK